MVGTRETEVSLDGWCEGGLGQQRNDWMYATMHERVESPAIFANRCGTCHMASLFTSLSRTTIATIFLEAVLQTCPHQLPQVLTATTAHRNIITSLQVGPLSPNVFRLSTLAGPLLAIFAPLPSHQKTLAHFYCVQSTFS